MGIKGIYKEIGAGARVSFLRLAVDSLKRRGRPLRLAIDISIWQFQVQAARGESCGRQAYGLLLAASVSELTSLVSQAARTRLSAPSSIAS